MTWRSGWHEEWDVNLLRVGALAEFERRSARVAEEMAASFGMSAERAGLLVRKAAMAGARMEEVSASLRRLGRSGVRASTLVDRWRRTHG